MEEKNKSSDPLIEELRAAESKRNKKTLLVSAVILGLALALLAITWAYSESLIGPRVDIEAGEAEVLEDTNDPACRAMIASVGQHQETWNALRKDLRQDLLGEDSAKVEELLKRVAELRAGLAKDFDASKEANLRFDDSRKELDTWFKFVDRELDVFVKLPAEKADLEDPEDKLNRALVATEDAFQNFRVWHTSSLHPCGAAKDAK